MRVVRRPHLREPLLVLHQRLARLADEGGEVDISDLVEGLSRGLSDEQRTYLRRWGKIRVQREGDRAPFHAHGPSRCDRVIGVAVEMPDRLRGWLAREGRDVVLRADPDASPRVGLLGMHVRLSGMRVSDDGITASFAGGLIRLCVGI